MCEITLNKDMQNFLIQQIKEEIPLEIILDTKEDKKRLEEDIYKKVINAIEGYCRFGICKDTNKDILKEEIKKATYEITSKKILSKELEIDERHIFVSNKDIVFIQPRNSYPYDESDENIIKKELAERLIIKKLDIGLFARFPLHFRQCDFQCEIKSVLWIPLEYKGLSFINCNFLGEVFLKCRKKFELLIMENCHFYKAIHFSGVFKENVFFNNSKFNDYVNFQTCDFEKTVSFYGVRFDKTPNFSQVIFKDSINLINVKTNFDFENLKTTIESMDKPKNETANDFRDSFRNFKSALIKDNNLLDASNFHKYELYCKEIELENKKDKTLKDKIDKWQLFFYHKLCDHHTDILRSLNSLILVIGIFVLLSVVMVFGFNYRLGYKPILEHWYFSLDFYNHHINSIIQDNYLFVVKVNLAMLFGYLILVGFALCLKYIREFFIIISYAITLSVLVVSPKILIPAMGIFTDKRAMLDPLSTIGGIYTIVFGFVVFSFIKTIRKNSIVPS
ncbi:pentapeptide repeat-containing protein [Campylobacter coli]|uniref:pentapeptide repeat-containing protein n=1 Tax=Campylobacter coli TaxID=195 RepID=UPI0009308CAF|nr:pentapeptide repeat-containing protein [Campylobacter coli]